MLTYVLRAALLPLGRHRRHQTKAKEAQLRARSPSGVNPPNPSVVQRLHLATLPLRRRGLLLPVKSSFSPSTRPAVRPRHPPYCAGVRRLGLPPSSALEWQISLAYLHYPGRHSSAEANSLIPDLHFLAYPTFRPPG